MALAAVAAGAYSSDVEDVTNMRYYVVTVGRRIGVFLSWGSTSPWVIGVPGSTFEMYEQGPGATARWLLLTPASRRGIAASYLELHPYSYSLLMLM
ncbi:hypothetical protein H0H92_003020 [Tricholoma furcatifolium]|nr:hypothetical protein H0H92_003020 [Tricholoma furcatifolium]